MPFCQSGLHLLRYLRYNFSQYMYHSLTKTDFIQFTFSNFRVLNGRLGNRRQILPRVPRRRVAYTPPVVTSTELSVYQVFLHQKLCVLIWCFPYIVRFHSYFPLANLVFSSTTIASYFVFLLPSVVRLNHTPTLS